MRARKVLEEKALHYSLDSQADSACEMGRVCADGTVTLSFPISERTEDDTRGNALA